MIGPLIINCNRRMYFSKRMLVSKNLNHYWSVSFNGRFTTGTAWTLSWSGRRW